MKKDDSKYPGLFKMCAGCSKKEKRTDLEILLQRKGRNSVWADRCNKL